MRRVEQNGMEWRMRCEEEKKKEDEGQNAFGSFVGESRLSTRIRTWATIHFPLWEQDPTKVCHSSSSTNRNTPHAYRVKEIIMFLASCNRLFLGSGYNKEGISDLGRAMMGAKYKRL